MDTVASTVREMSEPSLIRSDAGSETVANKENGLRDYTFPDDKLKKVMDDPSKTPLVLVACGAFSPITYLHLRMSEIVTDFVKKETEFEIVGEYLSPVSDAYKKKGLASAQHRLNMCQMSADSTPRLMVDPWEALIEEYTRTAIVLDHFNYEINEVRRGIRTINEDRKPVRIVLLSGADLIGTMSTPGVWSDEDIDHILLRYGAFIVERQGTDMNEALAKLQPWSHNIFVVQQRIQNDVSSTKIRACLSEKLSVQYLIPPNVIEYIAKHGLYSERE